METITDIFQDRLRQNGESLAIIDRYKGNDRSWTYEQLSRAMGQAAVELRAQDVGRGDPVLVFVPVSAELYACLLAIFELGAVAVFLDPSAGRQHMERCCQLKPPKAFIGSPKAQLLRLSSSAIRRIPKHLTTGPRMPATRPLFREKNGPRGNIYPIAKAEDPALITFTSGSTGQPKAAVRTHTFLIAQHAVLQRSIALEEGEIDLTTLPVFVLANLASCVTSVLPDADLRKPGAIDPGPVLRQIKRNAITRTAGSPAFYQKLTEGDPSLIGNLRSIKKLYTGGAPVFPGFLDRLHEIMPETRISAVFGSTEAEPIAHVEYSEISNQQRQEMIQGKGLLTGMPVSEIQLRILDDRWGHRIGPFSEDDFEASCLGKGETGEIVVTGDHVLKGYLDDRGNEETKFSVGETIWHRTGDAGHLDESGNLWLLGRCSARMKRNSGDLYPFAVEAAASNFPWIKRSAFVNVQGKRILAIESLKKPGESQLSDLRSSLDWAAIDQIFPLDRIPVDPRHNAKVNYPELTKVLKNCLARRST